MARNIGEAVVEMTSKRWPSSKQGPTVKTLARKDM